MSFEDQASDCEFMDRELALQQRKPTGPVPCGQCYNCGEMLSGAQRWCDGECRDDWERIMVDDELKELAALALRNAFYEKFSALVNAYLEASEGLIENQETRLGEMTSVFGRNPNIEGDEKPNIWTDQENNLWASCGHVALLEAFEIEKADRIGLNGKIIFKRINGEWFFIGDE